MPPPGGIPSSCSSRNSTATGVRGSWLSLVERWFRDVSQKRIRRGSFDGVDALITATEQYLTACNVGPTRFTWLRDADRTLAGQCQPVEATLGIAH